MAHVGNRPGEPEQLGINSGLDEDTFTSKVRNVLLTLVLLPSIYSDPQEEIKASGHNSPPNPMQECTHPSCQKKLSLL